MNSIIPPMSDSLVRGIEKLIKLKRNIEGNGKNFP